MAARRPLPFVLLLPALVACARAGGPSVEPAAGPATTVERPPCARVLDDPAALARIAPVDAATLSAADADGRAPEGSGCRLVVGTVDLADLRLVPEGIVELEGERPAGKRRRINPRRRELEARLRELEGSESRARRAPGTGDPLLDVVGMLGSAVIGLIAEAASGSETARLRAELERTPVYVEEPATARYRYEAEAWRLVVEGTAEVALVDGTGRGWSGVVPFRSERVLAIPLSRDPRDTTMPEGVVLVADRRALRRMVENPPLPGARELAAGLRHLASGPPAEVDLAALAARRLATLRPAAGRPEGPPHPTPGPIPDAESRSADGAAGLDPARLPRRESASVVRIRDGSRTRALAVYVAPDLLLTVAHALPEGALIPVEDPEGRVAYALVERSDPLADLALLWVPREGEPLPVAGTVQPVHDAGGGAADVPELWLPGRDAPERLGAPVVAGGRLLALVREDRTRPWGLAGAPLIRRFLNGDGRIAARPTPAAASRR